MISPQEPGDASDYSWSPFGPYNYWRNRIGADIAAEILTNCDENLPCSTCLVAARIALGEKP